MGCYLDYTCCDDLSKRGQVSLDAVVEMQHCVEASGCSEERLWQCRGSVSNSWAMFLTCFWHGGSELDGGTPWVSTSFDPALLLRGRVPSAPHFPGFLCFILPAENCCLNVQRLLWVLPGSWLNEPFPVGLGSRNSHYLYWYQQKGSEGQNLITELPGSWFLMSNTTGAVSLFLTLPSLCSPGENLP